MLFLCCKHVAIRAQRQRSFNELTGSKEYIFSASNYVSLTWEDAVDKIYEAEYDGLSPLNAQQLAIFPSIITGMGWLVFQIM